MEQLSIFFYSLLFKPFFNKKTAGNDAQPYRNAKEILGISTKLVI